MPVTHLNDFPDRFSPMLVKELRQGMRAKTFVIVFLSLQVFLALMMFAATASTDSRAGTVVSGIIFTFFGGVVLVIQPLRGISALSSEIKGNTLDMMALTRLSAAKIVLGKWVALVSQSALVLSTIIPYLILRYFFGGMNLFGELMFLFLMFLTSAALTAATVGLSGCSSVIVRSLLPILGLPFALFTMAVGGFSRGGPGLIELCAMTNTASRIGVMAYALLVAYCGASMLSLGASLIAPAAENHSLVRRSVALIAVLVMIPLGYFEVMFDWAHVMVCFAIAIPALVIALTDSSPSAEVVRERFARFGFPGKIGGLVLQPTFTSGVMYSILLCAVLAMAVAVRVKAPSSGFDTEAAIALMAMTGALLFPAAVQSIFFHGEGQRLGNYLLILAGSLVMLLVLTILAEATSSSSAGFLFFFAWHPLTFIPMMDKNVMPDDVSLGTVTVVNLILIIIMLVKALMTLRRSEELPVPAED